MKKIKSTLCHMVVISIIIITLSGCSQNDSNKPNIAKIDSDTSKQIEISWMIPTQQGITLAETPLYKHIQEKLNVKINLTELPVSQYTDKKRLLISSKQIPDIMSWITGSESNQYGPVGAFLDLTGYMSYMPNFKAKIDDVLKSNPDEKYTIYNANDKIYFTPHYQVAPIPIWDFSIVKSVFDEAGITQLDTWDQIYVALKTLKAKYPKSYPLSFRNLGGLQMPLKLFVESFTEAKATTIDFIGFDYDKNQFQFAPEVQGYSEAVAFFAKLYTEKLIDPDYTVLDEQMLKTRIIKNKVFMIEEYQGGWAGFPGIMRDLKNVLVPLATPKSNDKKQIIGRKLTKFDPTVGTIINSKVSADPVKIGRCLKFIDYLYSEEFYNFQYNHPDVADKQTDGSYRYKDSIFDIKKADYQKINDLYFPWSMTAIFQDSTDCRPMPGGSYENYRNTHLRSQENTDKYVPFPVVPFTLDEQTKVNNYIASILDRYNAGISVFAEGKRPINEWPAFVSELKSAGGKELIDLYNLAYAKLKK